MASGKSLIKFPPSSVARKFQTITKAQKSMMAPNELHDLEKAERRLREGFDLGKTRYMLDENGSLIRIRKDR